MTRARRKAPLEVRQMNRAERGVGRLSALFGVVFVILATFVSPAVVVVSGFAISCLIALRSLIVVSDSAILERKRKTGGGSPAEEWSYVERWAERAGTMPSALARKLSKLATVNPPAGEFTKLRALPIALVATCAIVFAATGGALALVDHRDGSATNMSPPVIGGEKPSTAPPLGKTPLPDDESKEVTYQQSCPELPDPLTIGHGLGELFHHDGAFKAGCGTKAQPVLETGAWFSIGICAGRLRSLAVADSRGNGAILYGAAARFALDAAQRKELVSAEAVAPAGGDVYVVETLSGSYGFARQAATSGAGGTEVRNCTEVTGTDRPFAELDPPMLLHWRDLVQRRNAWSWPVREDAPGDSLAFASYPDGEIVAHGVCASEFSCYLEVDGDRWPGNGTSHVSLEEFDPYVPPPAQ